MAKDDRLYAKFTLDFSTNPKIRPLSDAAFRCLVEATLWSRQQMTDGWLSKRLALAMWSLETLRELSNNDGDHPSLLESEHGWMIRDFAEHQDTKAEIRARRERYIAAGQKGGQANAQARAQATAKRKLKPKPSKIQAETETELLDPYGSSVLAADGRQRANGAPARDPDAYYDSLERQACPLCDDDGRKPNGYICDHIDRTETTRAGYAAALEALNEAKAKRANQ